jgi:tetratricopeptide (TPR) repeat protein
MSATRSPISALKHGQACVRAGRLDNGLAAFEAAGETRHPHLLLHHGLTLLRAGRGDEAAAKLAAAAASAPKDVVPAVFHAYVLLRTKQLDAAREALDRARSLSDENPLVPTLTAALDIFEGRVAEGCRTLLDGPVTDNLDVLTWILAGVERRMFEAVGPEAASGILPAEPSPDDEPPESVDLNSAEACGRIAEGAAESACPKAATVYAERAVELEPDSARWRTLYGGALFDSGRFEEAQAQFDAARFRRAGRMERLGSALAHRLRGRRFAGLLAGLIAPLWGWRSFWRHVSQTQRREGVGTLAAISRVRAKARDEALARKSFRPLWHLYRAANGYRLGRFDDALKTIDSMPDAGDAILYQELRDYIRGMVLVALNRLDEAAVHLGRYIDSDLQLVQRRLTRAVEVFGPADAADEPDIAVDEYEDEDDESEEIVDRQPSVDNSQSEILNPEND